LNGKLHTLETSIGNSNKDNEFYEEEINKLKGELKSLNSQLNSRIDTINNSVNDRLKENNALLTTQKEEYKKLIDKITKERTELINSLRKENAAYIKAQIENLDKKYDGIYKKIKQDYNNQVELNKTSVDEIVNLKDYIKKQLEHSKENREGILSRLTELEENSSKINKIENSNKENIKTMNELLLKMKQQELYDATKIIGNYQKLYKQLEEGTKINSMDINNIIQLNQISIEILHYEHKIKTLKYEIDELEKLIKNENKGGSKIRFKRKSKKSSKKLK
jgi:hypothetical protein